MTISKLSAIRDKKVSDAIKLTAQRAKTEWLNGLKRKI